MPEQSAWHTAREPMTISSSASAMAKLPLMEPLEPPTCMFWACASGSTPVEPGESTTAAPAASARRRTAASWPRVPPPALIATLRAAAISVGGLLDGRVGAGARGGSRGRSGRAARLTVRRAGWVLSGRSR